MCFQMILELQLNSEVLQRSMTEIMGLGPLRLCLKADSEKTLFGNETDRSLLELFSEADRKKYVKSFQKILNLSSQNLESHENLFTGFSSYFSPKKKIGFDI